MAREPGSRKQRRHRVGKAGDAEQAAAIGGGTLAAGIRLVVRRAAMFMRGAIRMDVLDDGIVLVDVAAPFIETMGARAGIGDCKRSGRSKHAESVERSEGERRSEPTSLGEPRQHRAIRTSRRHGVQGQSSAESWPNFATFLGQTESIQFEGIGIAGSSLLGYRETRREALKRWGHQGAEPPFRMASTAATVTARIAGASDQLREK